MQIIYPNKMQSMSNKVIFRTKNTEWNKEGHLHNAINISVSNIQQQLS